MKKINFIALKALIIASLSLNLIATRTEAQNKLNRCVECQGETTYKLMHEEDLSRRLVEQGEIAKEDMLKKLRQQLINAIKDQECMKIGLKLREFLDDLIDQGLFIDFDIDKIKTDEGDTLLKYAILNKAPKCVTELLNVGANPNLIEPNANGESYLILAIHLNDLNSVKALLANRRGKSRSDIDYVNKQTGLTALETAVKNGNSEIADFLSKKGAK